MSLVLFLFAVAAGALGLYSFQVKCWRVSVTSPKGVTYLCVYHVSPLPLCCGCWGIRLIQLSGKESKKDIVQVVLYFLFYNLAGLCKHAESAPRDHLPCTSSHAASRRVGSPLLPSPAKSKIGITYFVAGKDTGERAESDVDWTTRWEYSLQACNRRLHNSLQTKTPQQGSFLT